MCRLGLHWRMHSLKNEIKQAIELKFDLSVQGVWGLWKRD